MKAGRARAVGACSNLTLWAQELQAQALHGRKRGQQEVSQILPRDA